MQKLSITAIHNPDQHQYHFVCARKHGAVEGGAVTKGGHPPHHARDAAGPPPRAHRAQSSNLLIVNGALYVIDAGDGVARRLAKLVSTSATSERFSSPTIMTITPRVLAR